MQRLFKSEDQILTKRLKEDIVSGFYLEISYLSLRFNINTYWSKDVMGAVILQSEDLYESKNT